MSTVATQGSPNTPSEEFLRFLEEPKCPVCKKVFDSTHRHVQMPYCGHVVGIGCIRERVLSHEIGYNYCPYCNEVLFEDGGSSVEEEHAVPEESCKKVRSPDSSRQASHPSAQPLDESPQLWGPSPRPPSPRPPDPFLQPPNPPPQHLTHAQCQILRPPPSTARPGPPPGVGDPPYGAMYFQQSPFPDPYSYPHHIPWPGPPASYGDSGYGAAYTTAYPPQGAYMGSAAPVYPSNPQYGAPFVGGGLAQGPFQGSVPPPQLGAPRLPTIHEVHSVAHSNPGPYLPPEDMADEFMMGLATMRL